MSAVTFNFAPSELNTVVKLPLDTELARLEVTLLATSEAFPLNSNVRRRSNDRATVPSRRTWISKTMSTLGGEDAVPLLAVVADRSVTCDGSIMMLFRTRTKTFFMAFFIVAPKALALNPESRSDDVTTASLYGANVGC